MKYYRITHKTEGWNSPYMDYLLDIKIPESDIQFRETSSLIKIKGQQFKGSWVVFNEAIVPYSKLILKEVGYVKSRK